MSQKLDNCVILLGSSNYNAWKYSVLSILEDRRLYTFIDGADVNCPLPLKIDSSTSGSNSSDKSKETITTDESMFTDPAERRLKEIRKWQKNAQSARGIIRQSVHNNIKPLISFTETPREIWDKLATAFAPSKTGKYHLISELFNLKKTNSSELITHFNRIEELISQIETDEFKFPPELKIWLILNSLPAKFNTTKEIIITSKTPYTITEVHEALVRVENNEQPKTLTSTSVSSENMLLTQGQPSRPSRQPRFQKGPQKGQLLNPSSSSTSQPQPQSHSQSPSTNSTNNSHRDRHQQHQRRRFPHNPNLSCDFCLRRGHSIDQCFTRKRALEPKEASNFHGEATLFLSESADTWYFDTGATSNMTSNRNWLHNFQPFDQPRPILLGTNQSIDAHGQGSVLATTKTERGHIKIILKEVLYVPELKKNLISPNKLIQKGFQVTLTKHNSFVKLPHALSPLFIIHHSGNLPIVKLDVTPSVEEVNISQVSIDEFHRNMCHIGEDRLRRAASQSSDITLLPGSLSQCEQCIRAKIHRTPIGTGPVTRSTIPGEFIHSDLFGPLRTQSPSGKRYFVSFIDDATRFANVYFVNRKSEVPLKFKEFLSSLPSGFRVRKLHFDKGGEYSSTIFIEFLDKLGIQHTSAPTATPEYNGVAERFNRTIMELVRAMLLSSNLPHTTWAEAVRHAVYINNRAPTKANGLNSKSPYELWTGIKPSLGHLHPFGAKAHILSTVKNLNKLSSKSILAHYLGPDGDSTSVHRFWIPSQRRVTTSRDATFLQTPISSSTSSSPNVKLTMSQSSSTPESTVTITSPNKVKTGPVSPPPGFEHVSPRPLTELDHTIDLDNDSLDTNDPTKDINDLYNFDLSPLREFFKEANARLSSNTSITSSSNNTLTTSSSADIPTISTITPIFTESTSQPPSSSSLNKPKRLAKRKHKLGVQSASITKTQPTPAIVVQPSIPISSITDIKVSSTRNKRVIPPINARGILTLVPGRTPRSTQGIAPKRLIEEINITSTPVLTPDSYTEAISSPQANEWKQAMDEEYRALMANNTFTLVPLPPDRTAVKTRWVYKIKQKADGSVDRFKARWVARGYSQKYGIDYDQTFAPVVRLENLRMLLAYATLRNLEIDQMDVDSAFLQADLHEEVFITQPEGYISIEHPDHVCKLNRSLYGLKQASFSWYTTLDKQLRQLGFKPTDADPCIYVKRIGRHLIIVSIYVDDLIIIGHRPDVDKIKNVISKYFKIKDLGPAKSILGIEIIRDRSKGTLQLRQKGHIDELFEKFNMSNCKPASTPLPLGFTLNKLDKTPAECEKLPFRQAIGKLLYISRATRPDLAYTVHHLSTFLNAYDHSHWEGVKHVLRYLQGTRNLTITYSMSGNYFPQAYCDADWGNNPNTRKSVTGYLFKFADGPITWSSKAQSIVALSSTEAELNALSETAKQALYIRKFFIPLGITPRPLDIQNDNQSAIKVATQPTQSFHARMKHIDIKIHHLRDCVRNSLLSITYLPTNTMPADMLTKILPRPRFNELKTSISLL
jgi:transposase InsO family protein